MRPRQREGVDEQVIAFVLRRRGSEISEQVRKILARHRRLIAHGRQAAHTKPSRRSTCRMSAFYGRSFLIVRVVGEANPHTMSWANPHKRMGFQCTITVV